MIKLHCSKITTLAGAKAEAEVKLTKGVEDLQERLEIKIDHDASTGHLYAVYLEAKSFKVHFGTILWKRRPD